MVRWLWGVAMLAGHVVAVAVDVGWLVESGTVASEMTRGVVSYAGSWAVRERLVEG